jgi:hypothetical protein
LNGAHGATLHADFAARSFAIDLDGPQGRDTWRSLVGCRAAAVVSLSPASSS